jgi:hypothetical protein
MLRSTAGPGFTMSCPMPAATLSQPDSSRRPTRTACPEHPLLCGCPLRRRPQTMLTAAHLTLHGACPSEPSSKPAAVTGLPGLFPSGASLRSLGGALQGLLQRAQRARCRALPLFHLTLLSWASSAGPPFRASPRLWASGGGSAWAAWGCSRAALPAASLPSRQRPLAELDALARLLFSWPPLGGSAGQPGDVGLQGKSRASSAPRSKAGYPRTPPPHGQSSSHDRGNEKPASQSKKPAEEAGSVGQPSSAAPAAWT